MSQTQKLNDRVLDWAYSKEIIEKATTVAQAKKTLEEANELLEAVEDLDETTSQAEKERLFKDILLELGDVRVTLIILCEMLQTTEDVCLEMALDKIEKRTGQIIDGQFVKDSQ